MSFLHEQDIAFFDGVQVSHAFGYFPQPQFTETITCPRPHLCNQSGELVNRLASDSAAVQVLSLGVCVSAREPD